MRRVLLCFMVLLQFAPKVHSQDSYEDRAKKYVQTYASLAIEEQKRAGVPAAVTLGQGILETDAGESELMTQANNHFGIKCKSDWHGPVFLHDDDAPKERFKKYSCAAESYRDHSDYLMRNPRYSQLFSLKMTDYKAWAVCLRKCGYATNPQYAQNLIKIIEQFNLEDYTLTAMNNAPATSAPPAPDDDDSVETGIATIRKTSDSAHNFILKSPAPAAPVAPAPQAPSEARPMAAADNGGMMTINGMSAFYAHKGEMLLQYAVQYKIRYARLLELNDLPDCPLPFDTYVYLERKKTLGTHATHTVKDGECMLSISQEEGVQLKKLMAMNMLGDNEEPAPGERLNLQSASPVKPKLRNGALAARNANAITGGDENYVPDDKDYIPVRPTVNTTPAPNAPAAPAATPAASASPAPKSIPVAEPKPEPVKQPETIAAAPAPKATHEIVVKTEDAPAKPAYIAPKPVAAAPTYAPKQPIAEPAAKESNSNSQMSDADFARLKAELDKVVYADDTRLVARADAGHPEAKKAAATDEEESAAKYYKVKRGDTAFSIAKRNNISVDDLYKMNNTNASGIKTGKTLRIK